MFFYRIENYKIFIISSDSYSKVQEILSSDKESIFTPFLFGNYSRNMNKVEVNINNVSSVKILNVIKIGYIIFGGGVKN